jgi:hypothetical protein
MSDRKTMIPELLPDPKANTAASKTSPRERVVKQMREMLKAGLLATGSALAANGCAFGVVDPMPRPARCQISDVESSFSGFAVRDGSSLEIHIEINGDLYQPYFTFTDITDVQGGTVLQTSISGYYDEGRLYVLVEPENNASTVSFLVPFECGSHGNGTLLDGTRALRVTVFLDDATDGGTSLDGGSEDPGTVDAGTTQSQTLRVTIEPVR